MTFVLILSLLTFSSQSQGITNIIFLTNSLDSAKANFIIIGEQHTSAANPKIVIELLSHLNSECDLSTLVIEFSPSEAYLYNKFLATGDKELLQGTIYAGTFNEWTVFWEQLYSYSQNLNSRDVIKVVGIDFERPQTFAFAFNELLAGKHNIPESYDSLNKYMQSKAFKENHSNRFPTEADKKFMTEIRNFLVKQTSEFHSFDSLDVSFLEHTIDNHVEGFAGNREKELLLNVNKTIPDNENIVLMLIGEGHANYKTKNFAHLLREENAYNVISGKILYNKSELWSNGFRKLNTVDELKDKPWKVYRAQFLEKIKGNFSFIDLSDYSDLSRYYDYIIIASEQKGLTY